MKHWTIGMMTLAATLLVCSVSANAADEPAKGKKRDAPAAAAGFKLPDTIELSEEQAAKVAAIGKEYGPKFQALQKKMNEVLTREQRSARTAAGKAAREAGKKGPELQAAIDSAASLSAEQTEQIAAAREELKALTAKHREAVVAVLTAEQKAKLPQAGGKAKKKKNADN